MAGGLLAGYVLGLAIVALWPEHLDGEGGERVEPLLAWLARRGIPASTSYPVLEFSANVALFVPLGILLTLVLVRRLRPLAPIAGVLGSLGVETAQLMFLPGRTADPRDVVSNSVGFAIGCVVVLVLSRIRHGRYLARGRHRHRAAGPAVADDASGTPADQAVSTPVLSSTISAMPSRTR